MFLVGCRVIKNQFITIQIIKCTHKNVLSVWMFGADLFRWSIELIVIYAHGPGGEQADSTALMTIRLHTL